MSGETPVHQALEKPGSDGGLEIQTEVPLFPCHSKEMVLGAMVVLADVEKVG